jgi:hypothetical protein
MAELSVNSSTNGRCYTTLPAATPDLVWEETGAVKFESSDPGAVGLRHVPKAQSPERPHSSRAGTVAARSVLQAELADKSDHDLLKPSVDHVSPLGCTLDHHVRQTVRREGRIPSDAKPTS